MEGRLSGMGGANESLVAFAIAHGRCDVSAPNNLAASGVGSGTAAPNTKAIDRNRVVMLLVELDPMRPRQAKSLAVGRRFCGVGS
jgi:hypothetical protein